MQVILIEDVANVGDMGDVVNVADGYGRNFLIPKGMALPATTGNAKRMQHDLALVEQKKQEQIAHAKTIVNDIDGVAVTIPMRAGEQDKLFGSVTNRDLAEALTHHGVTVDRKRIQLERPITELGIYQVPIKLASGIYAHVKVWVVAM